MISPTRRVENMAYLIGAQLEMARTHSLGNRQLVRVDFDVVNASYTAYADHDDDDAITGVAAEIDAFPEFGARSLDDLVVFGRGSASAAPGDSGSGAVTMASERFSLDRQGVPTPWGTMGTIYLTHSRDDSAVAAPALLLNCVRNPLSPCRQPKARVLPSSIRGRPRARALPRPPRAPAETGPRRGRDSGSR